MKVRNLAKTNYPNGLRKTGKLEKSTRRRKSEFAEAAAKASENRKKSSRMYQSRAGSETAEENT